MILEQISLSNGTRVRFSHDENGQTDFRTLFIETDSEQVVLETINEPMFITETSGIGDEDDAADEFEDDEFEDGDEDNLVAQYTQLNPFVVILESPLQQAQ